MMFDNWTLWENHKRDTFYIQVLNPEARRLFQWILFGGGEGNKINLFYNYDLPESNSFNERVTYFKFLIARHCAKYIRDKDNYIYVGVWFVEHTTLNSL